MIRALLLIVYLFWMAGWTWAFSVVVGGSGPSHYSGEQFPFLLLALLCVAIPPLTGVYVLKHFFSRDLSAFKAFSYHLAATLAPLALFWTVYAGCTGIARHAGLDAFSAQAMRSIGIDYMLCIGVFLLANITIWLALPVVATYRTDTALDSPTSAG